MRLFKHPLSPLEAKRIALARTTMRCSVLEFRIQRKRISLSKTVRQHWDGILAYFNTHMTSAAIEAVNGVIQLAKRMARGFKNFIYFRTAAYHRAGKLTLAVPTIT